MSYPTFSSDGCRHDLGTYWGRVHHFQELIDPRSLFVSGASIEASKKLLSDFETSGRGDGVTDKDLWEAKRVCQSVLHPDTGDVTPACFRLSAFVPVNVPICAGMLLSAPTMTNTVFWQWFNQSFNAGFNYANRNASADQGVESIVKAYVSATVVSCGTAVGLGKLVQNATAFSPGVKLAVTRCVPFVAVASAGIFNAVAMRFNELVEGIEVRDEDGKEHGRSKTAARVALTDVALTRVAIPAPLLLLPPYIMTFMEKARVMPQSRVPKALTELGIITLCLVGAFPAAIAIFPQTGTISTSRLEPQFQGLLSANGSPIKEVFYNKGI